MLNFRGDNFSKSSKEYLNALLRKSATFSLQYSRDDWYHQPLCLEWYKLYSKKFWYNTHIPTTDRAELATFKRTQAVDVDTACQQRAQ